VCGNKELETMDTMKEALKQSHIQFLVDVNISQKSDKKPVANCEACVASLSVFFLMCEGRVFHYMYLAA